MPEAEATPAVAAVPSEEAAPLNTEPSRKRQAEETPQEDAQEVKKAKVEESGPSASFVVDLARVKRQVEYYFSDNNLRYDQFFHPLIAASADGWLPIANILSCRRIKNMQASASDILNALKDSDLETKGEGLEASVRRTTPLPPLEQRPERREGGRDRRDGGKGPVGNKHKRAADIHSAGCIIKCTGLPEEASWQAVRDVLHSHLPAAEKKEQVEDSAPKSAEEGKTEEKNDKKPPRYQGLIAFASNPTAEGECKMYLNPFQGDLEFFKEKLNAITVNGATVKVELVDDADEALSFIRGLPGVVRKRREKEMQRRKREINSKPVEVAGSEFASLDHLRKCLKEVLSHSDAGKTVNEKTAKVLKGLLGYHPNAAKKLQDAVGFKVDVISFTKGNQSEQSKCFFIVRSDGSCEDFSLQKCLSAMSVNPPFVEKKSDEATNAISEPAQENQEAEGVNNKGGN